MATPEYQPQVVLSKCPYCGNNRAHQLGYEHDNATVRVLCVQCGAMGPTRGTATEAAKEWNEVANIVAAARAEGAHGVGDLTHVWKEAALGA